jgi:hypothetical protein
MVNVMMTSQRDIRFARPGLYALAVVVAIGCGGTTAFAHPSDPHVRTISVAATPIIGRLLPDDEVVEIKYEWDIVVPVPAQTASVVIEEAVAQADLVAIVDVTEVSGFLAFDGIWINTRIVGTLREVLRSSKRMEYRSGESVEVQHVDGEMKIGNVLVSANGASAVRPHHSYLMFLSAGAGDPRTTVLFPAYTPLEIEHGELVSPLKTTDEAVYDPFDGWTLSHVLLLVGLSRAP